MPSFEEVEIQSRRVEIRIPAYDGSACWSDVSKAIQFAHQQLWAAGLVEVNRDAADNVIRVAGDDEFVRVFYVIETSPSGSVRLV